MNYSASIAVQGNQAHLVVMGELDAFTALQLRRQLHDALAKGCTRFTIDVAGITFVDAAGMGAFVRLRNAVTQVGGTFTFVAASRAFRRVCRLAGLTQALRLSARSGLVEYA